MSKFIGVLKNMPGFLAGKGATKKDIEALEDKLQLSFASDYKEYLRELGKATFDGVELTGFSKSGSHTDVVTVTKDNHSVNKEVPPFYYVIHDLGVDGVVVWQDNSGAVYQSTPGKAPKKIHDSLSDYVDELSEGVETKTLNTENFSIKDIFGGIFKDLKLKKGFKFDDSSFDKSHKELEDMLNKTFLDSKWAESNIAEETKVTINVANLASKPIKGMPSVVIVDSVNAHIASLDKFVKSLKGLGSYIDKRVAEYKTIVEKDDSADIEDSLEKDLKYLKGINEKVFKVVSSGRWIGVDIKKGDNTSKTTFEIHALYKHADNETITLSRGEVVALAKAAIELMKIGPLEMEGYENIGGVVEEYSLMNWIDDNTGTDWVPEFGQQSLWEVFPIYELGSYTLDITLKEIRKVLESAIK